MTNPQCFLNALHDLTQVLPFYTCKLQVPYHWRCLVPSWRLRELRKDPSSTWSQTKEISPAESSSLALPEAQKNKIIVVRASRCELTLTHDVTQDGTLTQVDPNI